MKSIPTDYLAGLTKDQQAELKRLWRLNNPLMIALEDVLKKRLEELNRVSQKDYDRPGWPFWRAARDGSLEELQRILELFPDRG